MSSDDSVLEEEESYTSPPISDIINESDGFLTFKLYDNVKSRLYFSGSFLVQFFILIVLIGVPWCFMETALGQYSGRGPSAIGDMVPIGKGVAVAMSYICLLNIVCYSPIQSRCLLYMYRSFTTKMPWSLCITPNVTECIDIVKNLATADSKSVGIELTGPIEGFYLKNIIDMDKGLAYDGIGSLYGPLLFCLGISWIVNFFMLIASDKFMKYVHIFGSISPFVLIFVLLLAIITTTNNVWNGFYDLFDVTKIDLLNIQSWRRAAEQVLYSLDVGTGHLIIYGRKCDFRNNLLGDILIVTSLDIICAVTSTLIVFGTANNIACKFHKVVQTVFKFGSGMFFISISRAVSFLPFPKLSLFLAYFIIFVICIITQISYLRPIIYLLYDYFPQYKLHSTFYCDGIICVVMFILSMITVTSDGEVIVSLLDDIGSTMGILMITTIEAILIFGIYGINEFCTDLAFMTDKSPSIILKILFIAGPVFTINILLACYFYWIPPSFQGIPFAPEIYYIAWMIAIITLLIILIPAIHICIQFSKNKNFFGAFEPTDQWVPDIINSLHNDRLNSMIDLREELSYENENNFIFGIGKPRLSIKIDQATQTNEENVTYLDNITNQRFQHFYFEVSNNKKFEFVREHDENELVRLDDGGFVDHKLINGVIEKYVQTD